MPRHEGSRRTGRLWTWFGIFTSSIYLLLVVLTIPLAFDVGGEDCGLAFTVTLVLFYFSLATIRLLGRNTKFSAATHLVYYSQHVIIPSLFIFFLNIYAVPERGIHAAVWSKVLIPWQFFLQHATAGFSILEGFCTLLAIQAAGQITRWLVKRNSDLWTIVLLVASGSIITGACYFLYRIYTFPITIGIGNATLIGVLLTCTTFLTAYGVVSGKGNLIESSLLVSYMVYCLYETFTDFRPTISDTTTSTTPASPEFPPVPKLIVDSYATVVASLAATVPTSFVTMFDFINAAVSTITPSVVVSLAYRVLVLFATTQIIPAIRDSDSRPKQNNANDRTNGTAVEDDDEEEEEEEGPTSAVFVTAYFPCVLIAVYAHLLMQHFGYLSNQTEVFGLTFESWPLWSWVNSFVTLGLYASEIIYGKESRNESLTRHWKTE
ncbi:ICE2-domain-containing protein [Lipomyces arxii]|uniref:ICE2-domain-containing protein n=1 Tax=Lipomyces arxii TaxID=56418 RepID=UPI0034D0108F